MDLTPTQDAMVITRMTLHFQVRESEARPSFATVTGELDPRIMSIVELERFQIDVFDMIFQMNAQLETSQDMTILSLWPWRRQ